MSFSMIAARPPQLTRRSPGQETYDFPGEAGASGEEKGRCNLESEHHHDTDARERA
jgi:hypothetical protein